MIKDGRLLRTLFPQQAGCGQASRVGIVKLGNPPLSAHKVERVGIEPTNPNNRSPPAHAWAKVCKRVPPQVRPSQPVLREERTSQVIFYSFNATPDTPLLPLEKQKSRAAD